MKQKGNEGIDRIYIFISLSYRTLPAFRSPRSGPAEKEEEFSWPKWMGCMEKGGGEKVKI